MIFQTALNIHNRFIIEKRNAKTFELKQQGVAHNIIVDRAYTRVCNSQSYFDFIHFGKGTGSLSSSRTTLFDPLGYKSAVLEDKIRAYPISKVTKKITLNPEEYVGQTITEVGISDSASAINTHALIKDAEGNPLSITKTDLDVIIIYATVFVELANLDGNLRFINAPEDNNIIKYFCDGFALSNNILLDYSKFKNFGASPLASASVVGGITVDAANRKRTISTRYGIDTGNGEICSCILNNAVAVTFPDVATFEGYSLSGVNIGEGDGNEREFVVPNTDINNLEVLVDGSIVSDYTIKTENVETLQNAMDFGFVFSGDEGMVSFSSTQDYLIVVSVVNGWVLSVYAVDKHYLKLIYSTAADGSWQRTKVYPSNDGKYFKNGTLYFYLDGNTVTPLTADKIPAGVEFETVNITETDYLRFVEQLSPTKSMLYLKNGIKTKVNFNTPPSVGSVVKTNYDVPYIPKSSDYVLDVTFELIFGEGV